MPTVSTTNTDQLTTIITVNITPQDYKESVLQELKKFRKKAHLKGFRKGQTPMSYIKKVYGKSVLAEELNNTAFNEVVNYLSDSKLDTLGQPIPAEDQEPPVLDMSFDSEYNFKYEIGLQPEVKLKGLNKKTKLKLYDVQIPEDLVDESIDRFRKENGKRETKEEVSSENDLILVTFTELEGDQAKEGGIAQKTSMIAIQDIQNDATKKEILKGKQGDTFDVNIYDMVKEDQKDHVNKYLLYVEDGLEFNETFRIELLSVTSMEPAEMSAALLIGAVGREKAEKYVAEYLPKEEEAEQEETDGATETKEEEKEKIVSDAERKAAEAGMRTEIRKMMQVDFERSAKSRMLNELKELMMEKNEVSLPEAYLKRWMSINKDEGAPDATDKEYQMLAEGLQWNILRELIAKKMDAYISYDEVEKDFKTRYFEMAGVNADAPDADQQFYTFLNRMEQQQGGNFSIANMHINKLQENIEDKIEEFITTETESVSSKDYNEMLRNEQKEMQKKMQEELAAATAE